MWFWHLRSLRITDPPSVQQLPEHRTVFFWCLTGICNICYTSIFMPIRHKISAFILLLDLVVLQGSGEWFCPLRNIGQCLMTFLVVTLGGRCYWHLASRGYWVLNILQCPGQIPYNKELTNPKCQQSWGWESLVNLTKKEVSLGSLLRWGKEKATRGSRHPICCLWTQISTRAVRNVYWLVTDSVYCWSVKEVGALWP